MTRHEAEKLLGGYATGTLTEQEKSALFSAALDHQELFDALVDEEALRQLLADPDARRRLLTLLPPEPEEPVRPSIWDWLRRPAAVGLAASLAGAAIVGVALWQYSGPEKAAISQVAQVRQAPPPAQPLAKSPEPPQPQPETKAKKARQVSIQEDGLAPSLTNVPAANAPSAPPPPAPAARAAAEKEAPPRQFAADLAIKQSAPEGGVVGGVIRGVPAPSALATTSGEAGNRVALLAMKAKSAAPEPSYILEHLEGDTARLNVKSPSGGNVYVIKRTAGGPGVMLAQRTAVGPTGTTEAVYVFPLSPVDTVDLYILPNPEANPAALPPGGPAGAFVRRVFPESKTIPPVR